MEKNKRFAAALEVYFASVGVDLKTMKPVDLEMLNAAENLDDLIFRTARDAEEAAERFSRWSRQMQEGRANGSSPFGMSFMTDLAGAEAAIRTSLTHFRTMLRLVYGREVANAVDEAHGAALASERKTPARILEE